MGLYLGFTLAPVVALLLTASPITWCAVSIFHARSEERLFETLNIAFTSIFTWATRHLINLLEGSVVSSLALIRPFLILCIYAISISAGAQTLANSSFETPALAAGTYVGTPAGASWTFSGSAGISNGSNAFTSGSPEIPDGKQVAFLQNTGSMQQALTLSSGAVLVFNATQRVNFGTNQTLQVLVNGVPQTFSQGSPSGLVSTTSVVPPKNNYGSYAVKLTSVTTTGVYTVKIAGTNVTGDATAFVDTASISLPSAHWYGLSDTGLISKRWRSDYPASTTTPQYGPCIFTANCYTFATSFATSNWTHSSNYVAGSSYWQLSWNDEPSFLVSGQTLCSSGPPNQTLPIVSPGTAGGAFSIDAATSTSDPAIGNFNVASIIFSSLGGTHASNGCIPYLGLGADYRHGNTKPIAVIDSAGNYRPHVKFHETVFDTDPNSVSAVRLVITTDGWADKIPRMLQVDVGAHNFGPESNGNLLWNWQTTNSFYYPGANVSLWDASVINSTCGLSIPSVSFANTYLGSGKSPTSIQSYDIDLYALLFCVASHGGWVGNTIVSTPNQRLPDPLVITHIEWALEIQDNPAVPAPGTWIAMWNPSIQ